MKRIITIIALILAISTSIVAATLSLYTTTINVGDGSVTAKEFILTGGSTNTFEDNIGIAPGEKVEWKFSVKNHKDGIVTETAMDLEFNIDLVEAGIKGAISPLTVEVKDADENTIETEKVGASIRFVDEFPLDAIGQEKTYKVIIEWPSNDTVDYQYAGGDYGSAIQVAVTGTQK